jgi:hypothetical protein
MDTLKLQWITLSVDTSILAGLQAHRAGVHKGHIVRRYLSFGLFSLFRVYLSVLYHASKHRLYLDAAKLGDFVVYLCALVRLVVDLKHFFEIFMLFTQLKRHKTLLIF